MNKRKNVVPNNLKEFRLKAGLTQKQVAEMLGMQCEDRLSHWEKGQSMPSVKNLFTLAKVYKALPHTLFPNFSDDLLEQGLRLCYYLNNDS